MRRLEWVERGDTIFKSDFEQHGLGKFELSITDPAYDIAETILHFALTPTEEHELLRRYTIYTGDLSIRKRLFLNKIRAGTWAMNVALSILNDSRLVHRHAEFHQLFTEAWLFLTFLAARRCGELCKPNHDVEWRSPLVILDVDGVLDRHVLGFPSTTQAGIRALSLLHSHGITVAVNTARTTEEVKEYCRAYGFAGGVAEYGAWAWDAITGNEVVLVNQKDLEQLDELAQELRKIPGVFMNDRCRYSVRAYMYVPTGTVPVPRPVIETLMSRLKVDRLKLHQTSLDTAITARTVDKGKGLVALKEIVGQTTAETASVGDTESDLSMFAVSDRSYAPKNMVSCWSIAKSMGCQRVSGTCQVGLLQIAQAVAHKKGVRCHHCSAVSGKWGDEPDLFLDLLRIADHSRISRLLGALLDPLSFRAFVK
jgi:hydroxymethylpyrimidine pyrophosphatase-like HAD family hydrolase